MTQSENPFPGLAEATGKNAKNIEKLKVTEGDRKLVDYLWSERMRLSEGLKGAQDALSDFVNKNGNRYVNKFGEKAAQYDALEAARDAAARVQSEGLKKIAEGLKDSPAAERLYRLKELESDAVAWDGRVADAEAKYSAATSALDGSIDQKDPDFANKKKDLESKAFAAHMFLLRQRKMRQGLMAKYQELKASME